MFGLSLIKKKAGVKGATWDGVRNYQAANNLKKDERWRFMLFLPFEYWKRNCWYS